MTEPSDSLEDNVKPTSTEDAIVAAISSLADHFIDHPGFMWTQSGFEVLHAKWPAYPIGHGPRAALYLLTQYPLETKFFNVDNIDRCTLFSVGARRSPGAASPEHLFAAIWDDDIRELARTGLIEGATDLEEDFVRYARNYITLTSKAGHLALIYELTTGVHPNILGRIDNLLEVDRCDAAIREASIILEQAIRGLAPETNLHGKQLIDHFFKEVGGRLPVPHAQKLQLKAEFLRFFAYVRNDFAHQIRDVDIVAASRMLHTCSRLLQVVEALATDAA